MEYLYDDCALGCAVCKVILEKIFDGMSDEELWSVQIAHEKESGHTMDIIPIAHGVKLEHLILLSKYQGYRLGERR